MNLLDFIKEFPDEASCRDKFKQYREEIGVVCPKWILHKSKLPFRYWFIAMHLLTATKKSKVLVIAESEFVENPKSGKKPRRVGYLKMEVIEDLQKATINEQLR